MIRGISLILCYLSILLSVSGTSILTQNVDNTRSGWNPNETILTAATVPKLQLLGTISTVVPCSTQVLYYEKLNLNGHTNVLFCWGNPNANHGNMTVYAFDADTFAPIWALFVDTAAIWATQAPAIDPVTKRIFGVLKRDNDDGLNYIIGIDILTGRMLPDSPKLINTTVPGTGIASVNGILPFANNEDPASKKRLHSDCRTSILIVNSVVYFGMGTFADLSPYHGWAFAYGHNGSRFNLLSSFCVTPNGQQGGIWAADQGLASDGKFIYITTGNGDMDPSKGSYSMAVIKLTLQLQVVDYFVPALWSSYSRNDWDLGGCGPIVLPNSHYVYVSVTKYGAGHLVDINNMGKYNSTKDSCHQTISMRDGFVPPGGNPIAWNTGSNVKIYQWATNLPLIQMTFNQNTELIELPYVSWSQTNGGGLALTSNGPNNPILWSWGRDGNIFAFDASKDVSAGPIWNVKVSGPDAWSWPTISNGKVYVNGGDRQIHVFGLK